MLRGDMVVEIMERWVRDELEEEKYYAKLMLI